MKIFKKYFLITATIVTASLIFMMGVLSFFVNSYLSKEKHSSLKECCNAVTAISDSKQLSQKEFITIVDYVTRLVSKTADADFLLVNSDGQAIYCSCDDYKQAGSCKHTTTDISSIFAKVTKNKEYYEVGSINASSQRRYYTFGTVIDYDSDLKEEVFLAFSPTSTTMLFMLNLLRMFLMAFSVTMIIVFFAVYYFSYRLTKPLRMMSAAAARITKGDFSRRIPVTGDDEVGELAIAFNNMTNALVNLESTRRGFVANVSHELKTPMTTIGGFIDGILDGTISESKRDEYLQIVSNEVKRLSRLVQSMLSLARLESGEMKPNFAEFNLSSVIIDIAVAQQQRIETRGLTVTGLDKLGKVYISADKDLIHQVIYNLVDNAVKFSNDGGEISFKVAKKNGEVRFSIKNTGNGIDAKDLPYIFERFYKTDRSRSAVKDSTGLGLYIVKTIIDIHHGNITVNSTAGKYTEFTVTLPQ